MTVTVPTSVAERISSVEGALSPFDEHTLSTELHQAVGDSILTPDERKGCVAEIFGLRFQPTDSNDRGPWDSYFGPMTVLERGDGTQVYLPDAADVDVEILQYWGKRSELTKHPILKARYADLAWEFGRFWNRNHSNESPGEPPKLLARRAADAYLQSVAEGIIENEHQAWRFLNRAIVLALEIKDKTLADKAKTMVFIYHHQQAAFDKLFAWWQIDDLLWDRKGLRISDTEQQQIIDSLQAVLKRHANIEDAKQFDPHHALAAGDRLARRFRRTGQLGEAVRAIRTAGLALESMAHKAAGLTAIAWLESLLNHYHGLKMMDDASRVEKAIRSRSIEARQSMKRIEIPIEMPQEEIEQWLEQINEGSLDLALARIARGLVSNEDKIRDLLATTAANAPLRAHLPAAIMGPGGFTAATVGSIKDDLSGRMLHQTADLIGMMAPWLYAALDRAKKKHGLDADRLFAYLAQCPFFAPSTHGLLKEGIAAWSAEDFVKAIHVLVPQVEAALREIMQAMGGSVMRPKSEGGGFDAIGMGSVLRSSVFETRFDRDSRLHLRAFYSEPKGINLRNKLAHGLAGQELLGAAVANWVIHSLILIGGMRPGNASQ
jgi:hypothetical protein